MSTHTDETLGGETHPYDERVQVLEDPALRELAYDLVAAANTAMAELTELSAQAEATDQVCEQLNQAYVDSAVERVVGSDVFTEAQSYADTFSELDRLTRSDSGAPTTALAECIAALVVSVPTSRDEARKRGGSGIAKCRKLVEYLDRQDTTLTAEQAIEITTVVMDPIKEMTAQRVDALTDPVQLASVAESLARQKGIDPSTRFDTIKCLVLGSLIKIYSQTDVIRALNRVSTNENTKEINSSEFGPHYWAAVFIADMKVEHHDAVTDEINMLTRAHCGGRLLGVPSRRFRETMKQLSALGRLYSGLEISEDIVKSIPEFLKNMQNVQKTLMRSRAGNIIAEALGVQVDADTKMTRNQNAKIDAEPSRGTEFWQEAIAFDALRVEVAQKLKDHIDQLGLQLDYKMRQNLEALCGHIVQPQLEKLISQSEAQELQKAANELSIQLHSLDDNYRLPNKRLRERAPELIGLAKSLSDSLNDSDPLTEKDARGLVGLMLGVYWERTGRDASPQAMAEQYLMDAAHIRELTAQLNALDRSEDSQLLRLINLLDELIDSGLFDDTRKHPELKMFEDFILAYVIAKDGNQEAQETLGTNEAKSEDHHDQEPIFTQAVPVEAVGQAEYEDLKVFPPGSTSEEIIKDYAKVISDKDMPLIEWERVVKLIELRDQFTKQNLQVRLIRTKHASWQVLPFFVLEVKLPGLEHGVAVVESPVYGNATYVYREAANRFSWQDVVQLERQEARDLGAVPAVHVDSKKLDVHFKKLWHRVISELTIAQ